MPSAFDPPGTISRLLGSPYESQVKSLQRNLRRAPLRVLDWFDWWLRTNPEEFAQKAALLSPADRVLLDQVSGLYQVVYGKLPLEKKEPTTKRSITDLMKTLAELTMVVAEKHSNSLLVRGAGGTGKTHGVTETLTKAGIPFVTLKGYTTPVTFYNLLYDNRAKLVVVDDCDSVFGDSVGLSILKAVLDTYEVRQVSWQSAGSVPRVPKFNFTGQIIFISNMPLEKLSAHMQALLTRVLVFNMDVDAEGMLQQIKYIALRSTYKTATKKDQYRVFNFLKSKKDEIPSLNLRHFVKGMDLLLSGRNWRRLFMETL